MAPPCCLCGLYEKDDWVREVDGEMDHRGPAQTSHSSSPLDAVVQRFRRLVSGAYLAPRGVRHFHNVGRVLRRQCQNQSAGPRLRSWAPDASPISSPLQAGPALTVPGCASSGRTQAAAAKAGKAAKPKEAKKHLRRARGERRVPPFTITSRKRGQRRLAGERGGPEVNLWRPK